MRHSKLILMVFAIVSVLALSIVASAETTLSIAPVEIEQGTATVDVTVSVASDEGILGAGYMEVYIPDGWTYVEDSLVYHKVVLSDIKGIALDAAFDTNLNSVSVLWDSQDAETPSENNVGEFFTVTLNVPADAEGEYEIMAEVTEMYVTEDWEEVYPTATGIVTVKGAAAAALAATGTNLYLDGGVGVQVFYDYTGADTLMVNGTAATKIADGKYSAYVEVAPKDYATAVTFTATASDVDTVVTTTSVAEMINTYKNDANVGALATALEVYCINANAFFLDGATQAVEANITLAKPSYTGERTINGLTFNSSSLILKGKVTLRHYFKVADGADTTGLTLTEDGFAYAEIANINVTDLATKKNVSVAGFSIDFAALDYVALTHDSADVKLANLVKALYNYHVAAVAYEGNN